MPVEDLQVGDHVYIYNHALYKVLQPFGAWRGEHALVTDFGNRVIQSDSGFHFMGHGMPRGGETGSIPRFYAGLLDELNTLLWRYYRIGNLFLFYMKSGQTAFPGKVTKETHTATDANGTIHTVDFYFFNLDFEYPDVGRKVPRSTKQAMKKEKGFVIAHINASRFFGVHRKKTIAEARTQGIFARHDMVSFRRLNPPTSTVPMFEATEWAIIYLDNDGNELLHHVTKKTASGGPQPVLLEMWELYSEPLAKYDPAANGIFITRPKVDVGSAYTSFLTTNGAM
jgi:hypothetical protein